MKFFGSLFFSYYYSVAVEVTELVVTMVAASFPFKTRFNFKRLFKNLSHTLWKGGIFMPENRGCGCGFGGCDCIWIIVILILIFCCCGNNNGCGCC